MYCFATPSPRRATSLALLTTLLAASTDTARAAIAEVGAVAEIRSAMLPAPIAEGGIAVQVAEASGTYAVPPGYNTITAWSHSAGTTAGQLTFKVYRPTGAVREFVVVASDTRNVSAGTVQRFPVQIPVQAGDRIGLSADAVQLAYETFNPLDKIGFFGLPDPLPGTIRATYGEPFEEYKLDVSATVMGPDPVAPPSPAAPPPRGAPAAVSPLPAPALSGLRVAPSAFRAARSGPSTRAVTARGSGTRVSYRLDMAAAVRFTVQRVRPGRRRGTGRSARCVALSRFNRKATTCTRYLPVKGSITRRSRAGANGFYFTGRLAGRKLARGSYRLLATPTAQGLSGRSLMSRFRVTR